MVTVYVPPHHLSTDNSVMIALAGHAKKEHAIISAQTESLKAQGNLELGTRV